MATKTTYNATISQNGNTIHTIEGRKTNKAAFVASIDFLKHGNETLYPINHATSEGGSVYSYRGELGNIYVITISKIATTTPNEVFVYTQKTINAIKKHINSDSLEIISFEPIDGELIFSALGRNFRIFVTTSGKPRFDWLQNA
jgi:hypothetical protein